MKKFVLIGFIMLFFAVSCSPDSDNAVQDFRTEFVPVASVEMPQAFELGQSYVIEYTYYKATTCHLFNDLFYDIDSNVHTIIIRNTVLTGNSNDCQALTNELVNGSFDFTVSTTETHYFRFWQGQDDSGQDAYLEFEVPVN